MFFHNEVEPIFSAYYSSLGLKITRFALDTYKLTISNPNICDTYTQFGEYMSRNDKVEFQRQVPKFLQKLQDEKTLAKKEQEEDDIVPVIVETTKAAEVSSPPPPSNKQGEPEKPPIAAAVKVSSKPPQPPPAKKALLSFDDDEEE